MEPLMLTILVGLVLVIGFLTYFLFFQKQESFSVGSPLNESDTDMEEKYASVKKEVPSCVGDMVKENFDPVPSDPMEANEKELMGPNEDPVKGNLRPNECYPKDSLNPEDLLPNDKATAWSKANPAGTGKLSDQNFLHAGFHVGINTVGQSLRNANLQLRSEPPNPTKKVGPWMQSTIEPDLNRLPLEISK